MPEQINKDDAAATLSLRELVSQLVENKVPEGFELAFVRERKDSVPIPVTQLEISVMGGHVVLVGRNTYKAPFLDVMPSGSDFLRRLEIVSLRSKA